MTLTRNIDYTAVCDLCGHSEKGQLPDGWWDVVDTGIHVSPRCDWDSKSLGDVLVCPNCVATIVEDAAKRKEVKEAA